MLCAMFQDLDIGARHIRVFVGGELMYDGHLEKGCGNQVFDYSQVVDLRNTDTQKKENEDSGSTDTPPSPWESNFLESRDSNGSCDTNPVRSPLPSPPGKPILSSVKSNQPEFHPRSSTKLSPLGSSHRSQTRTLNYSTDEQFRRPTVESEPSSPEADDNMKGKDACFGRVHLKLLHRLMFL